MNGNGLTMIGFVDTQGGRHIIDGNPAATPLTTMNNANPPNLVDILKRLTDQPEDRLLFVIERDFNRNAAMYRVRPGRNGAPEVYVSWCMIDECADVGNGEFTQERLNFLEKPVYGVDMVGVGGDNASTAPAVARFQIRAFPNTVFCVRRHGGADFVATTELPPIDHRSGDQEWEMDRVVLHMGTSSGGGFFPKVQQVHLHVRDATDSSDAAFFFTCEC